MFSAKRITPYIERFFGNVPITDSYEQRIADARKALAETDCVLIGAGAGLSTAAGLDYGGACFKREFAEFIARYGFTDLYTSSFYNFQTEEERWAYWAKHIGFARFAPPAMKLYGDLFRLVSGKDYFVITTNVDGQFRKTGFAADRLFEVQGDYAYLQCAEACHDRLYYNEALVREMSRNTENCKIPSSLAPRCPVCGGAMEVNLRKDERFVEDAGWHARAERYERFLEERQNGRLVLLELGVGYNTPGIVRFPFERMTAENSDITLIRLNRDFPGRQTMGKGRFIGMNESMTDVIRDLNKSN